MTEIRFYHNAQDKLVIACKLAVKACRQNRRIVVFAPEYGVAERFNQMLWSVQPLTFIPHVMADNKLAARTPIVIANKLDGLDRDDVLINLDGELPPSFARFQTLLEIVSQREEDRNEARKRWTFYKERGYPLQAHDLSSGTDGT